MGKYLRCLTAIKLNEINLDASLLLCAGLRKLHVISVFTQQLIPIIKKIS
jgi:hypothetical protein